MPFDGTTAKQIRRPKCDPTAAQSALVLDMVELFFRDGAKLYAVAKENGEALLKDGYFVMLATSAAVRRG